MNHDGLEVIMRFASVAVSILLRAALPTTVAAQSQPPADDNGAFVLYKFAKSIGKETFTTQRDAGGVVVTSDFLFTDRGSPVPLKSTYKATPSLEPVSLTLAGKSSRFSELNDTLQMDPAAKRLTLQRGGRTTTFPTSSATF